MSQIKVLSEQLVNQIAAGEVVERPASVVKELVENSLDAGATKIEIEIEEGGKKLIRVTDNGKGMLPEDLRLAVTRHATSKIATEADLWKIGTMGFRGEALASICAISRFSIRSRRAESSGGYELKFEGENLAEEGEIGMSPGTKIEVDELFFNTPARKKYLKKDSTEIGKVSEILHGIALANPEVDFVLKHNGKVVFDLPAATTLEGRIVALFGSSVMEAMIPVFYGGSAFQIDGFVGKPLLSRTTSKHQYFLVNGRPIQHHVLAARVKAAFHSMLMENKKPIFVINIKIDPSLIDVNVHPRKVEIRFEDEKAMISAIYGAVKVALEKTVLIPKGFTESQRYMSDSFPASRPNFGSMSNMGRSTQEDFSKSAEYRPAPTPIQQKFNQQQEIWSPPAEVREQQPLEMEINPIVEMIAVAQIAKSYIIAKKGDELVLIDQHAAHERVRYEELMRQFHDQKKEIQPLLTPLQVELSTDEISLLDENKDLFENLGFEMEPFGGNTYVVHSVPSCLVKEDVVEVVKGVLDDIVNDELPTEMQGRTEEILTYMSCRSAIKFGQKLSLDEMQVLINQLSKMERPYTCPHGRPTMVSLTTSELAKMFGRK